MSDQQRADDAHHVPVSDELCEVIRTTAEQLVRLKPNWSTFVREILGPEGIVSRTFPSPQERQAFEQTPQYARLMQMLGQLRNGTLEEQKRYEPTRMITVRLPASLHELLEQEAVYLDVSVNQLCISKLLQLVEKDLLPPKPKKEAASAKKGTTRRRRRRVARKTTRPSASRPRPQSET